MNRLSFAHTPVLRLEQVVSLLTRYETSLWQHRSAGAADDVDRVGSWVGLYLGLILRIFIYGYSRFRQTETE